MQWLNELVRQVRIVTRTPEDKATFVAYVVGVVVLVWALWEVVM